MGAKMAPKNWPILLKILSLPIAAEVKPLASLTALATTEISAKITQIQESTARAAGAMENITGTIANINRTSVSIAHAVDQQNYARQEIVQAVSHLPVATFDLSQNISRITQGTEKTSDAANKVHKSSRNPSSQYRLHLELTKFFILERLRQ